MLLGAAASVSGPKYEPAHSPPNLGELKSFLLTYQASGQYAQDLAAVVAEAQDYLDAHLDGVAQPAMVLDIDETSLSNWNEIQANDFGFFTAGDCTRLPQGPCGALAWDAMALAKPMEPKLALFNHAKARHIAIFFITGRHESERTATELNLHRAGYKDWEMVIMEPDSLHPASAADFKAPERGKLEQRGYQIIVNVGDQQSDLSRGHADKGFRLPNPTADHSISVRRSFESHRKCTPHSRGHRQVK